LSTKRNQRHQHNSYKAFQRWKKTQELLFDSDYPLIAPDRWLEDFEKIAIRDNVRQLFLKENAMRLFGLA
jgi:predicted TIM-barrel fold metal-dependent hydrolase